MFFWLVIWRVWLLCRYCHSNESHSICDDLSFSLSSKYRSFLFVNTRGYGLILNDEGMSLASVPCRIILVAPHSIMALGFESV